MTHRQLSIVTINYTAYGDLLTPLSEITGIMFNSPVPQLCWVRSSIAQQHTGSLKQRVNCPALTQWCKQSIKVSCNYALVIILTIHFSCACCNHRVHSSLISTLNAARLAANKVIYRSKTGCQELKTVHSTLTLHYVTDLYRHCKCWPPKMQMDAGMVMYLQIPTPCLIAFWHGHP